MDSRQDFKASFLPRLGLKRPISAMMVLIAVLAVGFIAYTRIPAKMMPEGFNLPMLWVWIPYTNASPREVEEQITKPVEEIISTVRDLKRMEATSSQRGMGMFLEFESGTDMALAYNQVIDRLDRVMPELPSDIQRRYVHKWSPNQEPVMWIAIEIIDPSVIDPYDLVDRYVKRKLERINGVANVEIWGARQRNIYIQLNNNAVQSHKVNMYQLWSTLRSANFTLSGGHITEGDRKLYITSNAKFKNLEEIRNLVIRGTTIRVKDVAEVNYDFEERRRINRVNMNDGITLGIFAEDQADPIALSEVLKSTVNEEFEKNEDLKPFNHYILFTQGDIMTDTIDAFKTTALYGGIFAFLILFFFLRRLKTTLIISLALPMSLLIMITILYFMGWSLNMITMMGLILSVGMVVDNSIVVAENIYRHRLTGKSRHDAAIIGSSEVGLAITMSTLTTIVVFLPIIVMGGNQIWSFFLSRLGAPIIFAILASLFIALYFIPLGTAVFHEPEASRRFFLARWFDKLYNITVEPINRNYSKALKFALNHRFETIILFFLIFLTMFVIIGKIPQTDSMEGNINDFVIRIDMPDNFNLQATDQRIQKIEAMLKENKDRYQIRSFYSRFSAQYAWVRVFLKPVEKRDLLGRAIRSIGRLFNGEEKQMSREDVIEDIKKYIDDDKNAKNFTGMKFRWSWHDSSGSGDTAIDINIYGKDLDQLELYSNEIKRRMMTIPGVLSAETDYEEKGKNEIQLQINRRMAKNLGVDPMAIAGTVAYSLRGNLLTTFQMLDKEIEVYLQIRDEDRQTLEQLKNLSVISNTGQQIPLSVLVQPVVERGPSELKREDRKTMMRVKVTTTKELSIISEEIQQEMSNVQMRRGYTWSLGRRYREMMETQSGMGQVVLIIITFVSFLMGVLFESFILPLSVLASIPFSFWGAFWMLFITGTTMDPMAYIGMAILIGVVVNNAIVLIDLVNRLRNQGYERFEALIEAGRLRFRPIVMTALTTIFGLLPMTIGGSTTAGISYAPLGRAFTGGLLASTVSTLFLVPLFYTLLDDLRVKVGNSILRGIFARKTIKT